MYRNIVYMIDKNNDWEGKIQLFTWDEKGIPITIVYPHKSQLFYESPIGKYSSIFNTKLEKKIFKNVIERSQWIRENKDKLIFNCLPPVREFLVELYQGEQEKPEFTKFNLRTQFIDIEIAVESEFPDPAEAKYPINIITVYDSHIKKYICWVYENEKWPLKEKLLNSDNTHFLKFNNESDLLKSYIEWTSQNYPDVITGWNTQRFDIPYLINRFKRFFEKEFYFKISPVNQIIERELESFKKYIIEGISSLDYFILYKDKFNPSSKQSYKLEDIAQEELGYGKVEKTEITFKDFYIKDFSTFVKYNIQDVKLCVDLEQKLKYIELARKVCNFGLCEYETIYKSQPYLYGAILLEALNLNLRIPSNKLDKEKDETFEGAFVFSPQSGLYKNGVFSIDLNSLYPNIMINCNISPETKVGKIINFNETKSEKEITVSIKNSIKTINRELFYKQIQNKLVISANGILFIHPNIKEGIIPKFLKRLYLRRVKIKNQIEHLFKEKSQNINLMENLDKTQWVFKVFLNSIYGQIGSQYFPLSDFDCACSVTISGQKVIQKSSTFINNLLREKYNFGGISSIYGDTDSLYINAEPIIRTLYKDKSKFIKWNNINVEEIIREIDKNIIPKINQNCLKITKKEFLSNIKNIEFKRESFCKEAMFLTKKKYILHILYDENGKKPENKSWKFIGVQIKKNELPTIIKDYLKEVIIGIISENWNQQDLYNKMVEIKKQMLNLPIKDLAFIRTYRTPKKPIGFLKSEKGTLAGVRGIIYFNQIIKHLKILNKYQEILLMDRFRYIVINKENEFGIDVISFKEDWPLEFNNYFNINYPSMFKKIILSPLKRVLETMNWKTPDVFNEEICDIFDL